MLFCFLSFLLNNEYLNLFVVAAFSYSLLFDKTSSLVKNSYLPTFPDDKAEILVADNLKCIELFFLNFAISCFDFLNNSQSVDFLMANLYCSLKMNFFFQLNLSKALSNR